MKKFYTILAGTVVLIMGFSNLSIPKAAKSAVQKELDIEPIIITAERIPFPKSKFSANVSIITKEDIEKSGALSLGEILQNYSSITFQQSGSFGKESAVRMRGSGGAQLLFLLDGVRINDSANGGINLTNLSPDNVERIEIVRGGVSSLYGSEGMNGVINIITKKPSDKTSVQVKESYGSYSTSESTLIAEGKTTLGNYRIFANNAASKGLRDNDNYRRRTLGGGFSFGSNTTRFNLNLQGVEANNGLSIGWGGILDKDDSQNDHLFFGSLLIEHKFSEKSNLTTKLYDRTTTNTWFSPPTYSITKNKVQGIEMQLNHRIKSVDSVYGLQYERLDSFTEFPDWFTMLPVSASKNWYSTAFFINTVTLFPHEYRLSIGTRYDDYSHSDTQLNPKFSLAKSFKGGITTYLSTGKNFRAPTFNDLYYPNYGNPKLKPERSTYKEFGIKYKIASLLQLNISGFNYKYQDLIIPTLVDPVNWLYAPMNVNRAKIKGIEMETLVTPGYNIEYAVNYTHLDTLDYNKQTEINRAPTDQYGLRISYQGSSRWSWTLNGRVVSSIYDTAINKPVNGYTTFDGKLVYSKSPKESYFLEGNNIFDTDYSVITNYPAPGIALRIGLEKKF